MGTARRSVVASAFDWPGWDCSTKLGSDAVAVLDSSQPRLAKIAELAGRLDPRKPLVDGWHELPPSSGSRVPRAMAADLTTRRLSGLLDTCAWCGPRPVGRQVRDRLCPGQQCVAQGQRECWSVSLIGRARELGFPLSPGFEPPEDNAYGSPGPTASSQISSVIDNCPYSSPTRRNDLASRL